MKTVFALAALFITVPSFANIEVKVQNNNIKSSSYAVEPLTIENLSECRGWFYDNFWKTICPPSACIAGPTHGYSLHHFTINLKNGQSYNGVECTPGTSSDVNKWLVNIKLSIDDVDTKCVKSEVCNSEGACKRVYGQRTRSYVLAGNSENDQVIRAWQFLYNTYSQCK